MEGIGEAFDPALKNIFGNIYQFVVSIKHDSRFTRYFVVIIIDLVNVIIFGNIITKFSRKNARPNVFDNYYQTFFQYAFSNVVAMHLNSHGRRITHAITSSFSSSLSPTWSLFRNVAARDSFRNV